MAARSRKPKDGYHHGDLRRALLDAAKEMLRDVGPAGLSLREVAKRAGVSHAAPYHHFADKRALLVALVREAFEGLDAAMAEEQRASGADPWSRLFAAGTGYARFARAEPSSFKLMWQREWCGPADDPELQRAAGAAFARLLEAIAAVHAATRAEGDPLADALVAWCVVHGFSSLWIEGTLPAFVDDPEAFGAWLVRAVATRMKGAPDAPPPPAAHLPGAPPKEPRKLPEGGARRR